MTFWLGMSGASNAITRSTLIRNWRVSMRKYESPDNSLLEFLSCDSFGGTPSTVNVRQTASLFHGTTSWQLVGHSHAPGKHCNDKMICRDSTSF